jgi:tRNA threonylcarbamoyladenosine biosynthesis protein TsaB
LPSTPELSLVLDLSACLSLGLVEAGGKTPTFRIKDQGTRGENAHALLDECLADAGLSMGDIGSICVGIGPGSFTGIRVCAAMAQGLAFARRLPLYPFSSLAAIAACAPKEKSIAAIAANAGRYFIRREASVSNAVGASGVRGGEGEALASLEELLALGGPDVALITAGNVPDRERLKAAFGAMERFEDFADFGRIARLALSAPPVLDGVLRPNYLMASAAEEKRRAASGGPAAPSPGNGSASATGDAPAGDAPK